MDSTSVASVIKRQSDGTKELLSLLQDPFSGQLYQTGVEASLITTVVTTIVLAVAFSFFRPYNSLVYAPKLKVADDKHAPPALGRGIFAWVKPILVTKEQELIALIGLDATIFLRVLRMCRNMFAIIAVVGCAILVPVNLSKGAKGVDEASTQFILRVTPLNTWGEPNWAITICAWIFNLVVCLFLWWNYRAVLRLRRQYYDSAEYQNSLHARTLMITDIPKNFRSDEGIGRLIDEVVPTSSFSRTSIARNVKELPLRIEEHNQTVRSLEKHLAKYLKDPTNLPPQRPQCYPSKKDPNYSSYPKGQKVDAIEYLTGRIRELELEVKEVRLSVDNRNPLPYGFASYEDIEEAHSIAFAARKKHPEGTTIVMAPRPNDIIWKNMPLSKAERRNRRMLNNFWIFLLTVAWVAPNALISIFLVRLSNLGRVWKAFNDSLQAHNTWWSIVQGVAAPAITSLVYLVLPIIFRRLAIRAGDTTKTSRERHVTSKLYTFFVINYLIVFTGFSVVWSFVTVVIQNTRNGQDAWSAIQHANFGQSLFYELCNISAFWITWLLQRNTGAGVDLAQLWTLFWSFCVRKLSNPTPRELIELTAPPAFDYASYYNYFLFYSTVTLCFATIQPLAIPAAAVYFAIDIYLKKYLLLYIFVTKTESGGMFWRIFFNRMIFATILSNLVVFLAVWVRGDGTHYEAYVVVPLPFLMLAFKWYCRRTFDDKLHYYTTRSRLPDTEAPRDVLAKSKRDRLASRFGHPALYRPLITPMVHAKAQNILASVYAGRLSDSNNHASDSTSVSGYSDTYVMDPMRADKPGRKAAALPGFEIVPENRLDFEYYKGRAEFGEEHGGMGGIYGRAEDIVRSDTPGSSTLWEGSDSSRPGTPGTPTSKAAFTHQQMPTLPPLAPVDSRGDMGYTGRIQQPYGMRNDSQTNLIHGAADMPSAQSGFNQPGHIRDDSQERRAPGFLGGGPGGYGGLPQQEEEQDPMSYDYFRSARRRDPGP
ncbi:hypothetical protein OIDMADRAFT_53350 [Oidiodendron maius Zn]|uniref:CSC1/OSCA1-like 7TM region domain-containing protein n=1 Tax=Oidiodendron maius (strain Zn) TaxID=913774 RepID=A0A0C3CS45_OIDMZ|nr:hypothetical protein OIDMADRAFT_53350 [Oidiodendron maius Zn]